MWPKAFLLALNLFELVYAEPAHGQSDCALVAKHVAQLSSLDAASVAKACGDREWYAQAAAKRTVTRTRTKTVATVTSTVVKVKTRSATLTRTKVSTTTTSITQTLTNTVTSYYYSYVTETSTYPAERGVDRRQQDVAGALGIPSDNMQLACSCFHADPAAKARKRVTKTVIKSVTRTVRKTSTRTVKRTRTLIESSTLTALDIQGEYTYVTEHPDSTLTLTVTTCSGANPTPDYKLQVVDSTPTRTDRFNSKYLKPTPYPLVYERFWRAAYEDTAEEGGLFNIDCLGRLYTVSPNPSRPRFFTTGNFFPGFETVYLLTQQEANKRDYLYFECSVAEDGLLDCLTRLTETFESTMLQTCPLYARDFKNPLVIADSQSTSAPECFGLRFKRIDASG